MCSGKDLYEHTEKGSVSHTEGAFGGDPIPLFSKSRANHRSRGRQKSYRRARIKRRRRRTWRKSRWCASARRFVKRTTWLMCCYFVCVDMKKFVVLARFFFGLSKIRSFTFRVFFVFFFIKSLAVLYITKFVQKRSGRFTSVSWRLRRRLPCDSYSRRDSPPPLLLLLLLLRLCRRLCHFGDT